MNEKILFLRRKMLTSIQNLLDFSTSVSELVASQAADVWPACRQSAALKVSTLPTQKMRIGLLFLFSSAPRGTLLLMEGSRRPYTWHPGTSFPAMEMSSTPTWKMCGCLSFWIHFTTLISNPPPLFSLGFYDCHAHLEAPELTLCRSAACFWLDDFPWKTGKTPVCGGENIWMWCELKRATSGDCAKSPTSVC